MSNPDRPATAALLLEWLLPAACPLCARRRPPGEARGGVCPACADRLALPRGGLQGSEPLPWWSAGSYEGSLRSLLLGQRRAPRPRLLTALLAEIRPCLEASPRRPLLVPVPSWKRRPNPLPPLLCQGFARQLGLSRLELLERSHPVLGQHHLGRALRFANQKDSFRCRRPPAAGEARRHPLLLVDDILTSGATALAAAEALRRDGWRVQGLLCLARTPARPQRAGPGRR